jgi:Tol biopolymer transport system component
MSRRKLDWKILGLIGIVLLALVAAVVVSSTEEQRTDLIASIFGAGGGKDKDKDKGKSEDKGGGKDEDKGGGKDEDKGGGKDEDKGGGKDEDKGQPPGQAEQPPGQAEQPPAPPADTKGQPGAAWTRKGLDDTKQNQNIYAKGDALSYHTANMPQGDYTVIVHKPGKHGEVVLNVPVKVGADGSLNVDLTTIPDDWKGVYQVQIWGADGHKKNDNINVKGAKKPEPPCKNPPCNPVCEDPPCDPPPCENPPCGPVCEDPPCGPPPECLDGDCTPPKLIPDPPPPPVVAKQECELCGNSVIFHSDRSGAWELYRLDAEEGSYPMNLTSNDALNLAPSRSLDSQWVTFQSNRDGNWEVYVMDIDGDRQTRLTYNSVADDVDPVWAPQCIVSECASGLVAFQSNRDGNWEIYVVDALTGEERRMTYNLGWDENPYWSPDGQWIAFQSNRDGNWEIYMVSVDGQTLWRLTNNGADDMTPVWSPNGQQIAFLSNRDGKWGLYVVDVNGENLRMLTDAMGDEANASWSPDGTALAFQSNRDGNWEIYTVAVATGALTRLTSDPASDQYPSWSCTGGEIVFTSDRNGNAELYAMSAVDGSGVQQLTADLADDICPLSMPVEEDGTRQ